jgi:hypothetical protein
MSLGRLAENLEKARQNLKSNRSRLVASTCLVGVAIAFSACEDTFTSNHPRDPAGLFPPPAQHGAGSGGGGGGGGTG